jgi:co-chaperonin GroES (HSP10)
MIIDAGPEVTEFKLGQKILFKKFTPSEEDGNRFGYIHEEDVLGIMFSEN